LERIGDVLRAILDARTVETGEKWHRFFSSWQHLVGPDLAGLSRLLEVERDEAVVVVEHPAAFQLLGLHKQAIMGRIAREFPELGIRGLRVRVVPPEEDHRGEDGSSRR
jgi:hypothetical protein